MSDISVSEALYIPIYRHNGASLRVIRAAIKALPNTRSIAFFDTAFHKNIPAHVAAYAMDQNIAKKRGLRKYGFHGLSCEYAVCIVTRGNEH